MLQTSPEILNVWRRFDSFPSETLTKAWFLKHASFLGQRNLQQIREHRRLYGASGNSFDLAIWLIDELRNAGIEAHGIGSDLGTPQAHAAVVALGADGRRYLCDLGGQWLRPYPLDHEDLRQAPEGDDGFVVGARIRIVETRGSSVHFEKVQPDGERAANIYDLRRISDSSLFEAGHDAQSRPGPAIVKMRLFDRPDPAEWVFEKGAGFIRSSSGTKPEPAAASLMDWCFRIEEKTGMAAPYVEECLRFSIAQDESARAFQPRS